MEKRRIPTAALAERERVPPSYSPDCNPIELGLAKFEARLRRVGPRAQEVVDDTISKTIGCLTANDALGFMRHCGFRLPASSEGKLL
jgi:hypothetical protein